MYDVYKLTETNVGFFTALRVYVYIFIWSDSAAKLPVVRQT